MIKETLNLLMRKSKKHAGITLINIFGLSAGIAVFILISMWIRYERGYDSFQTRADNVYRLSFGNSTYLTAGEGPYFEENSVEIEKVCRFQRVGKSLLGVNNETFQAQNVWFADSTVFDLFSFELILGNKDEALRAPFTMVISESISKKLFGDESPLGKPVMVDGAFEVIVTGVMKDVDHTFMPVDVIGSFVTLGQVNSAPDFLNSLRTNQFQTYFLLKDNIDIHALEEKIDNLNITLFDIEPGTEVDRAELVSLSELYFHPVHGPAENHGNSRIVMIFLAISILTITIACINFINLTIARSSDVATETGIRKVNGATQAQLFARFIVESLILCLVSSIMALTIIQLSLPGFSNLIGVSLTLSDYLSAKYIVSYFAMVIAIGLAAGLYPALLLSAYSPIHYLKSTVKREGSRSWFRTTLVIFQFTISTILIVSVMIVSKQLSFIRNYDHGFDKDNVVMIYASSDLGDRRDAFMERLRKIPGVKGVTMAGGAFSGTNFESLYYLDKPFLMQFFTVLPGFVETMGIDLLEGRDFSYDRPADRINTCILNEKALELLEIPVDKAVGTILTRRDWYITTLPSKRIEVIGVVKDFNYRSLRDSITPVLICWGDWYGEMEVKIGELNSQETLTQMEAVWQEFLPAFPFEYRFMDDYFEARYNNEKRLSQVLIYFSVLAILIASFGLLGLTAFMIQARTKEIGLRKVHGATRIDVIRKVSAGFMKWVAVALLIGTPVSVLIMRQWLAGFAYRTGLDWWIFAVAWLLLLIISFVTILYHTLKISATNPVDSIRHE